MHNSDDSWTEGHAITFGQWIATTQIAPKREVVAYDEIRVHDGLVTVATRTSERSKRFPLVFQTCVRGGIHTGYKKAYSTPEAAIAGHEAVVSALKNGDPLPDQRRTLHA
jgi:hypothetical protein